MIMTTYKTFVCLFVSLLVVTEAQNHTLQTSKSSPRSVFAFGDSFVDVGNNNFIPKAPKSNFPPYGTNFPGGVATGRFSDGLLFPDILANHVNGAPFLRAYLDPTLDPHLKDPVAAISFGSATSGYDGLTTEISNAIPMTAQLEYFKEYKRKLEHAIGKREANRTIENAIFYINAGSFDFALALLFGGRNQSMLEDFGDQILRQGKRFLKGLVKLGATNIAVTGLPPLGCIPIGITVSRIRTLQLLTKRRCIEAANTFSKEFNVKLQKQLKKAMKGPRSTSRTKIAYIDFESPLLEITRNRRLHGFTKVNRGCCGTGLLEIGILCNAATPVCSDPFKFVFFDASNPTQETNIFIFRWNLEIIDELINNGFDT